MPPRKGQQDTPGPIDPNADQSASPPGAVEDATEAQERKRRSKSDAPRQGDSRPAYFRGLIVEPVDGLEAGTKPESLFVIKGSFFDPISGTPFEEPKEWLIRAHDFWATQSTDLKESDGVIGRGRWIPTYRAGMRQRIDNEIDALEVFPTKEFPALDVVANAPEIEAPGGMSLAD